MAIQTISPRELNEKCMQGEPLELIDVRTPVEYAEVHAKAVTRHMPLDRLEPEKIPNGAGPVYMICKSGARGARACEKLVAAGFNNVVNVEGGTSAWIEAGLPVVRGQKVISLERQVRIAAGILVLIGVALGAVIDEWFYLLSGFVGAGLVFAGITDFCGMGLLLARMPWNNRNNSTGEMSCQAKS
jgi:rhodanese-related sulfurtransferase